MNKYKETFEIFLNKKKIAKEGSIQKIIEEVIILLLTGIFVIFAYYFISSIVIFFENNLTELIQLACFKLEYMLFKSSFFQKKVVFLAFLLVELKNKIIIFHKFITILKILNPNIFNKKFRVFGNNAVEFSIKKGFAFFNTNFKKGKK